MERAALWQSSSAITGLMPVYTTKSSLMHASEKSLIRARMEMGYREYINKRKADKEAHPVGRPKSYRKSEDAYREQYAKELTLLRKGISLRNICKLTGVSVNTLRRLKKYM